MGSYTLIASFLRSVNLSLQAFIIVILNFDDSNGF
jgi:hypothetical protein